MSARRLLALAAAACAVLIPTAGAQASLQPLQVSVDGGEGTWHAEREFTVRWSNPPGVAAVHYRLLNPGGGVLVGDTRLGWPASAIQHLSVPQIPGAYAIEVWLEDSLGAEGPAVSATLRFDDSAPGGVAPEPAPGWIGGPDLPLSLRLGHPAGAVPLAGIRGYAVSIDTVAGVAPCGGPISCAEIETDLHGGIAADTVTLAELPAGVSHLNAVAVSGSGIRSTTVGSTALRVDRAAPETLLAGVPAGWSRQPVVVTANAEDGGSGMAPIGTGPTPFTAIRVDAGTPIIASGDTASATIIDSGEHELTHYARDAAGNVADGALVGGSRHPEPGRAVVRIDREPPGLAFAGAQDPADPEQIAARVEDPLSGVDGTRGTISVQRLGSGEPFEPLPTRLSAGLLSARWDSDSYPRGEYEFRATAFDLAGNRATTSKRRGGAPMRLRNPLKTAVRVSAHLARQRLTAGRRTELRGWAVAGRRAALAGAALRVIESFDPGAGRRERTTTIRTRADGSFALRLQRGPSRSVRVVASPTPTLSGAGSKYLRLTVRGGVRMRASARVARVGGRPVVFSGRVRGAPIPAEGKLVELQFRLRGASWSEFRTLRTDRRGRFRYRYRFADDDSRGVRFGFRAFVPAQADWPFGPAGSRPVTVRGR